MGAQVTCTEGEFVREETERPRLALAAFASSQVCEITMLSGFYRDEVSQKLIS